MFLEKKPIALLAIKKNRFSGSYKGMRYMLEKTEEGLLAHVYPEPYSYENTEPGQIESKLFEFSESGYEKAVDWLNDRYDIRSQDWKEAAEARLV